MKKNLLLIALLSFSVSHSQLVFQDDFSAYTVEQSLNNQGSWTNNSSLPGGLGAPIAGGTSINVIATPISYAGYGNSPNSIQIKPNSDACGLGFTDVTAGDVYIGFVLNLSAAQVNNNSDFFRVMSNDNYNTSCRLYAVDTGFEFNLGVAKGANGNPIAFTNTGLSYDQNHLIIIKYSQNSATTSDDTVSIYIDPAYALGQPSSPTIFTNSGLDQAGSIDRLTFRQNWTNGMPTGRAGLVSVALSWESLGLPLSTNQFESNNTITIASQNAKTGFLTIQSAIAINDATLRIFALNGTLLQNKTISIAASSSNIPIAALASSGYIVEITSPSGKRYIQKIIVQ